MTNRTFGWLYGGALALSLAICAASAGCDAEIRSFGSTQGSIGGAGGEGGATGSQGGAGQGGAGQGGAGQGGAVGEGKAILPVPPDSSHFDWQSVHTRFLNEANQPCDGLIVMAINDQVMCYRAADKSLQCAGRVYTTTFGTTFVDAGLNGVEQVLFSPTFSSATGNAMCVKLEDGTARCMGDRADSGQFGNGSKEPTSTFVQYGDLTDIHRIASGTADQLCAITTSGVVHCAGYNFGLTPVLQDGGAAHTSLWVNTFGDLKLDDPTVYRAETGRTECQVTSLGLECSLGPGQSPVGPPGMVVDGTGGALMPALMLRACALTAAGKVSCVLHDESMGTSTNVEMFQTGTVLAIAGNRYTDTLCAAYNDGSIWCVGTNQEGKLGTGNTTTLQVETMVQPPGSIDTSCK